MAKKIKLTEEQLQRVLKVVKEETYDQSLVTHNREKSREVFMSHEEANLMGKLAYNWCQDKASDPKCEELNTLTKRLRIETF